MQWVNRRVGHFAACPPSSGRKPGSRSPVAGLSGNPWPPAFAGETARAGTDLSTPRKPPVSCPLPIPRKGVFATGSRGTGAGDESFRSGCPAHERRSPLRMELNGDTERNAPRVRTARKANQRTARRPCQARNGPSAPLPSLRGETRRRCWRGRWPPACFEARLRRAPQHEGVRRVMLLYRGIKADDQRETGRASPGLFFLPA
jgi:hypothetical protein